MHEALHRLRDELQHTYHQNPGDVIPLFPGIDLAFLRFQAESFSLHHPPLHHVLQINYCRTGRMGWQTLTGNYCYLGPGNFSVHGMDACADSTLEFPTGAYEGILISMDFQEAVKQPPELLAGTDLLQNRLPEKFCRGEQMLSFAGTPQTAAIFSSFYENYRNDQLDLVGKKLKVLELLLLLGELRISENSQLTEYRSEQVELMREIHQYLLTHLEQRITIAELSRQYHINPTTLKATFKSVYGTSLAAHIKEHRMQKAADLLAETTLSIAEVARAVGYDSQSKFSTAFHTVFDTLPKDFRQQHRRNR